MEEFMGRYSQASLRRCVEYFRHDLRDWSPLEWGGALMGEVGELCNVLKKLDRVEKNLSPSTRTKDILASSSVNIMTEIGDCYAYLDLTAQRMGTTPLHCATISEYRQRASTTTGLSALAHGAILGGVVGGLINYCLVTLSQDEKNPDALRIFPVIVSQTIDALGLTAWCVKLDLQDCATHAFNNKSREIGCDIRV